MIKRKYYPNGNIEREYYCINSGFHNENGPAIVTYYESGNIKSRSYYINGKYHNERGPAYIWYSEMGCIMREGYWMNGVQITDELQLMVLEGLKNDFLNV